MCSFLLLFFVFTSIKINSHDPAAGVRARQQVDQVSTVSVVGLWSVLVFR